jgi:hypothetical protein
MPAMHLIPRRSVLNGRLRRPAAVLATAAFLGALLGPTTATAQTDYCRIQGGGWFHDASARKVTFSANLGYANETTGFREHFDAKAAWPIYGRVSLETFTRPTIDPSGAEPEPVTCTPFGPEPGDGGTLEFVGMARCHDGSMVEIQGTLTDTGEDSGKEDMQKVLTRAPESDPGCTIASSGPILGGNIRYWPIYG